MEADESDRSFLLLAPVVAVVTTIDREHLDQYTSLEDIQDAFTQFVNRVPFYGAAILCLDEPNVQAIIPHIKRPIITYGTSSQADLVISDIKLEGLVSEFSLTFKGEDLGSFRLLHPPGIHNVRNAAAAAAVALYLNVPVEFIRDGLAKFAGVGRRFDIKGVANDITVIDDYGHHPVEIRATLEAAKICKFDRLLVLFQPHRFSRTQHLWDEFCRAFNLADILVLTDIYPASEAPIAGVTSEALAAAIRKAGHKHVHYFPSIQAGIEVSLAGSPRGRRHHDHRRRQHQPRQQRNSRVTASGAPGGTCALKTKTFSTPCPSWASSSNPAPRSPRSLASASAAPPICFALHRHDSIPDVVKLLDAAGIPFKFLGGGSNLLVADGELPWVVLQLSQPDPDVVIEGNFAMVDASAELGRTVTLCAKRDLGGMEGLIGVPGTVGGALRMNAGAYGIQIGTYVREVKVYRAATRSIETLKGDQISFEYRHTSFAPDDMMLAVKLELPSKPFREILQGIRICNEKRRASQPLGQKSAGCIFKNPPGASAGRMIDELGLKGHSIGDAQISDRHANFFINAGKASAADMLALIADVRERLRKAYGFELENEVVVWTA